MHARMLTAVLAGLAAAAPAAAQQTFRWTGRIEPGRTLEIRGVNGDVHATVASGGEAEVIATKTGRRSDPERVEIRVVEHDGGVTICAVYPTPGGKEPNECRPGGGRNNVSDNDVHVRFEVKVPASVAFVGRTVNGDVTATGLGADADASTVNGDVEIATRGTAAGSTVNGSVRAAMGRADWEGTAEFSTVNGNIELDLPARLDADVRVRTVNGELESDYPLTVRGKFGRRRVDARIGAGGRVLSLETVNGRIRLRRAEG